MGLDAMKIISNKMGFSLGRQVRKKKRNTLKFFYSTKYKSIFEFELSSIKKIIK